MYNYRYIINDNLLNDNNILILIFAGNPKEFIQLYDKIKPVFDKLVQKGKIYGTCEEFRKFIRQFQTDKGARRVQRVSEEEIRSGRINEESVSKRLNFDDIQRDSFDIDNVDEILDKVKKEPDEVFKKVFTPISSRLDEISPTLKHAIRKFELDSALAENKSAQTIKPFIEKVSKMAKMSKVDYAKYDLALKNGNKAIIDKINSKYGISEEYGAIKDLLANIR